VFQVSAVHMDRMYWNMIYSVWVLCGRNFL